jgi:dTDP-4-dehydrorhamnose 3,5-epimerase|tara:strand:- start:3780 stop:4301 length:522 start_codon:yes stop_codon:yes gene_type:complete
MKKIKTKLKDLLIFETKVYHDQRGNVREAFKKNLINKNLYLSVVSKSKKNVIRGLHFQTKKTQDKFISVVKGKILDVVVDLRKYSKTFGQHYKIILSENKAKYLFVPKGFAHGFLGLDKENIVVYSCSNYRDSKYERILKWNDKDLKINWGIKKPILSLRDQNGQSFAEFINK